MSEQLDRRQKYTRRVLKESMIQLLKEKPISSITVKEICLLADINRSTFYSHYADLYDLLNQIEEEIIHDIEHTLSSFDRNDENAVEMLEKLLEYLSDNRDSCQTLFSDHGNVSFQKKVMKIANDHSMSAWMKSNERDQNELEYLRLYTVHGCIHVIQEWLKNGIDKTPKQMAKLLVMMINQGLSAFQTD